MKRKVFSVLLIAVMLISTCPAFGADEFNIDFTVTERSGEIQYNYLIKRGFPVEKGVLKESDAVIVVNSDGTPYPTQTRVMEKYDDGSVKWIMAAFVTTLAANQTKVFSLKKGNNSSENVAAWEDNGTVTVNNGTVTLSFTKDGMTSLKCNNREYLNRGEELYCTQDDVSYKGQGESVKIREKGSAYVIVEVTGTYTGSAFSYKKTYTIARNAARIGVDSVNISSNGTVARGTAAGDEGYVQGIDKLNSLYEKLYLCDDNTLCAYGDDAVQTSCELVSSSSATVSANGSTPFCVGMRDIDFYRYAFGEKAANGLYFNAEDKSLTIAPIIYKSEYQWMDGLSRTTHYDIVVGTEEVGAYVPNPPSVNIPAENYVKAGLLGADSGASPLANAQIDEIKWLKDNNGGRINAGAIPYSLNSLRNTKDLFRRMTGEADVNGWYAVMASGDWELYDVIYKSALAWADCAVYRGSVKDANGIGRFSFEAESVTRAQGHCYYGEFTNMYLTYLMTGDWYFYDTVKLMADKMYDSAQYRRTLGSNMVCSQSWLDNTPRYLELNEVRDLLMIQALYNSSKLLCDEKYARVAENIIEWMKVAQQSDGSFAQSYDVSVNPVKTYNSKFEKYEILYKNYLMLYGMRGPCRYYEQTHNEELLEILIKFGDYLITEIGERGWMYDPCSDNDKCETGEDLSRGKAPFQEMMASEVFLTLYRATDEEKYLKALCVVLESYMSSCYKTGFSATRFNERGYQDNIIGSINAGQNTTLLKIDSWLCKLFEEKRALIEQLGYKSLCDVFMKSSVYLRDDVTNAYFHKEVSANLFETVSGRYMYIGNNSGFSNNHWEKYVSIPVTGQEKLFINVDNVFTDNEMSVSKNLKCFETVRADEIPVKITNACGNITFNVKKYTADTIIIEASGNGSADSTIENGLFAVNTQSKYLISQQKTDKKTAIVIKKDYYNVSNITAEENKIKFTVNVGKEEV